MANIPPFHLAFPVSDIAATEAFYAGLLGCKIGRRAPKWIDFDFFGHQISAHLKPEETAAASTNQVDGDNVPVRHFGAILPWGDWHRLADRLKAANIDFIIEPHVRFKGEVGEQATMFFKDPSGNALEFKSFEDPAQVFAVA
jgi:extradiol dioxygenase family protein